MRLSLPASLLIALSLVAPSQPPTLARTLWTGPAGSMVYAAPSSHAAVLDILPNNQPVHVATAGELDRLIALYQTERTHYASHPDDALKVIGQPVGSDAADLAAWTMVANVLLNLDEAVTKE